MTTLSDHQNAAVSKFCDWFENDRGGFFYLGGYAGTGKSTILPYLIEGAGLNPDAVKFAAPTGKAAKVMTTKLRAQGIGSAASTIHKLIYTPFEAKIAEIEDKMAELMEEIETLSERGAVNEIKIRQSKLTKLQGDLDKLLVSRDGPQFLMRGDTDFSDTELIVIDEASMVGNKVTQDLLSFGVPILAIGDPGQLPPVGDEAGFTAGTPDAFLTEIHRQAADNPIIWLSKQVREGKPLKRGRHGDNVRIIARGEDAYTTDTGRGHQVIVGRNATRWRLTERIRAAAGYTSSAPSANEPLIVCKNSKKAPSLVNGSFVTCDRDCGDLKFGNAAFPIRIEDEEGIKRDMQAFQPIFEEHKLKVKGKPSADPRDVYRAAANTDHFDWGWAITCHKSQGSQWDKVVVHDESGAFREDWTRWLYTAITRAATDLTVIE